MLEMVGRYESKTVGREGGGRIGGTVVRKATKKTSGLDDIWQRRRAMGGQDNQKGRRLDSSS